MIEKSMLMCVRLPARLTTGQAAELLNFTEAEMTVLARKKILCPLANPNQNSHKWYASKLIITLMDDEAWLKRATAAIYADTRERNSRLQKAEFHA